MYQALYRKYRSQTFSQLVGQEVVAKTLKQAVEQETKWTENHVITAISARQ